MATAEIITKAMDLTAQQIHYDPQLYAANLSQLKNALALCPNDSKRVLLIGHNPELESLLVFLNKDRLLSPDDGKLLPININNHTTIIEQTVLNNLPNGKVGDTHYFLLRISSG
jgi:phosphohistidine phosphatase SixA